MTGSDIVAIVGAAAWAPQIIQWINEARKKPKLELIPAPTVVLGYTPAGPVIQLAASISSQNRDVIVTEMIVRVQHESREERLLKWSSVAETLASFNVPEIPGLSMNKTQNVLAVKAITETLTEKYLTFNDSHFQRQAQEKINVAREHFNYLSGQVKEPAQEIIRSKEFQQAVQFLTDSVFWREGTYVLEVQVSGKQLKGVHREAFQVTLTRREIEGLQANLQLIEEGLQEYVTSGQRIQKPWAFIHPSIRLASG